MGRAFGPEFTGMATNLNAKAQRREDAARQAATKN
jgi:hypothetical protein